MSSIRIDSIARYIPPRVVTNDDLSEMVDTSDEWITTRTGIKRRHFAEATTKNSDQAIFAARKALAEAGISAQDIDAIIVATFTPDMRAPSTATIVHSALGANPEAISFDMNGACAGFLYGLHVAKGLLLQKPEGHVLLIASELISSVLDFTDRSTCVLFGDGAAATVLSLDTEGCDFFLSGTENDTEAITCRAYHYPDAVAGIGMHGQDVFRFACGAIEDDMDGLLRESGLSIDDIDHVVCHQANARIIQHVIRHRELDPGRFFMNLEEYGNTSAASIPSALAQMVEEGMMKRGDTVMLLGFGAGLVHGGMVLQW